MGGGAVEAGEGENAGRRRQILPEQALPAEIGVAGKDQPHGEVAPLHVKQVGH